jgi:hypothetical protein
VYECIRLTCNVRLRRHMHIPDIHKPPKAKERRIAKNRLREATAINKRKDTIALLCPYKLARLIPSISTYRTFPLGTRHATLGIVPGSWDRPHVPDWSLSGLPRYRITRQSCIPLSPSTDESTGKSSHGIHDNLLTWYPHSTPSEPPKAAVTPT